MGRKSAAKRQGTPSGEPPKDAQKSSTPLVVGTLVVAALIAGVIVFRGATAPAESAAQGAPAPVAEVPESAKFGPHTQDVLPPLDFPGYQMPRSPEVIRAAYKFAAEHPEIASYIPCFCGCGRQGHRGNEDCFVRARDANGDVVAWEEHGMECAVCIDVATQSAQMFASGASVKDIRAAVDATYAGQDQNRTITAVPQ